MMGFTTSASETCQVRSSIRTITELPYQTMPAIFKNEIPYNEKEHKLYFLGFFEECWPELIKKFMAEQDISRQQIIDLFYKLPQWRGELYHFKEALKNGEFKKSNEEDIMMGFTTNASEIKLRTYQFFHYFMVNVANKEFLETCTKNLNSIFETKQPIFIIPKYQKIRRSPKNALTDFSLLRNLVLNLVLLLQKQ